MKLRRSQNTAVISRRWPASSCSPSALETSAATWGDRKRDSSGALAIDRLEQPRVADADGRLIGERARQPARRLVESAHLVARQGEHADHFRVLEDRQAQQGAVAEAARRATGVLDVGLDVPDLRGRAGQRDAAHQGVPAGLDRMAALVRVELGGPPAEATTRYTPSSRTYATP